MKLRERLKKQRKNNLLFSFLAFLILVFFCPSCGYHLSQPRLAQSYQTIEVPYVKGDEYGLLTEKIISCISSKTNFKYAIKNGDIRLRVEFMERNQQHIGFQYDTKTDGTTINRLVPNESRNFAKARITLEHPKTDEILFGPFEIQAEADYDFVNSDTYTDLSFRDQTKNVVSVLPFSLGQLNSWQEATQASAEVLYRKMADNIIELLEEL